MFPRLRQGLPWWLSSKEFTCNVGDAGDMCSIPRGGRCPGKGNCNPLQYSCQEDPMDKGAWWAASMRLQSRTWLKRLRTYAGWKKHEEILLKPGDVCAQALLSCLTLWPHGPLPTRLLCSWDFPGKNIGGGCHSLFQGIFLIQGLNLCLLPWQADSLLSEPPGKPLKWSDAQIKKGGECHSGEEKEPQEARFLNNPTLPLKTN